MRSFLVKTNAVRSIISSRCTIMALFATGNNILGVCESASGYKYCPLPPAKTTTCTSICKEDEPLVIDLDMEGIQLQVGTRVLAVGSEQGRRPLVTVLSDRGFPSLADGRDVSEELLKDWQPGNNVTESILNNVGTLEGVQVGRFRLGQEFSLSTWDQPKMQLFHCIEVDPYNQKFRQDRAIVITHSMILQLQVASKCTGHLVLAASFDTLKKVLKLGPKLVFEWEHNRTMYQQLVLKKPEEFLTLLSGNVVAAGGLVRKPSILIERTSTIEIAWVLQGIEERETQTSELSAERTQELLQLYQEAVEHYSAMSDPKFHLYLQKMRGLHNNEQKRASWAKREFEVLRVQRTDIEAVYTMQGTVEVKSIVQGIIERSIKERLLQQFIGHIIEEAVESLGLEHRTENNLHGQSTLAELLLEEEKQPAPQLKLHP